MAGGTINFILLIHTTQSWPTHFRIDAFFVHSLTSFLPSIWNMKHSLLVSVLMKEKTHKTKSTQNLELNAEGTLPLCAKLWLAMVTDELITI